MKYTLTVYDKHFIYEIVMWDFTIHSITRVMQDSPLHNTVTFEELPERTQQLIVNAIDEYAKSICQL